MSNLSKAEAEKIVGKTGWLATVPDEFRTEVLRQSVLVHLSRGEALYHMGDPAGGIYGLVDGTVSISLAPAGQPPRLVMLGVPGYWTGEACFLTRKPRRGDVRAVVDTTMLHVPLEALDRLTVRDPAVSHYIALILMMSVEFLLQIIHDLQKPLADRRIASVLQRTTSIGNVAIPLTQTELGVMANASRKQVNAALKRFADAGWLSHTYRSITIRDVNALRGFAEADGED